MILGKNKLLSESTIMNFGSQLLFHVLFYFHIVSQGLVHIHLHVFLNQKRNSALRLLKTDKKSSMFHSQSGAPPICFLVTLSQSPLYQTENAKWVIARRGGACQRFDGISQLLVSKGRTNIFQAGNLLAQTTIFIYLFILKYKVISQACTLPLVEGSS